MVEEPKSGVDPHQIHDFQGECDYKKDANNGSPEVLSQVDLDIGILLDLLCKNVRQHGARIVPPHVSIVDQNGKHDEIHDLLILGEVLPIAFVLQLESFIHKENEAGNDASKIAVVDTVVAGDDEQLQAERTHDEATEEDQLDEEEPPSFHPLRIDYAHEACIVFDVVVVFCINLLNKNRQIKVIKVARYFIFLTHLV